MEAFLRRCLDSLIVSADQLALLDIMVVNDGSKDATSSIGHEYARNYPDAIRVIDKQNGHYGSCINAALKIALGKYIRVLDADDYFDNKAFSLFLDAIQQVDADVIVTDYNKVDSQGNILSRTVYQSLPSDKVMTIEEAHLPVLMMHGLTYRTDLLRRIQYRQTEGILYTDSEWSFIPLLDAENVCCVRQSVYQYLIEREGQSMSKELEQKMMPHRVKVLRSMLKAYSDHSVDAIDGSLRMALRNFFINIYLMVIVNGQANEENKQLIMALDDDLKSDCPDMYQYVGQFTIKVLGMNYKVIERWRNHKLMNVNLLHQLIRVDNICQSLAYKLRTWMQSRKS